MNTSNNRALKSISVRGAEPSFVLRLVIKHPTLPLDAVSREMRIERHQGHSVGEKRMTPKGTPLEGVYRETFWGHSERVYRQRDFFAHAVRFIESLADRRSFFNLVNSEGGKVALFIDVLQGENIGDVLKPEQLATLSSFGVELGVEFFP